MRAAKGSKFERKICKVLSKWWTGGERDDVFWRSSQSGGRATRRAKKGKKTYGSYGDIAAVDPIGEPLLKLFTIELKIGKSHGTPMDIIDCPLKDCFKPFENTLLQAHEAHIKAGSCGWMVICKRDFKNAMVYADLDLLRKLEEGKNYSLFTPPVARFSIRVGSLRFRFAAITLEYFLKRVTPASVKALALVARLP